MASLGDIRKRIRSVHGSQKITRAMKMVAASKLRRAQDAIVSARPYAKSLEVLLGRVLARAQSQVNADVLLHPLLEMRDPVKRTCLVVISSDRGSCGAFNSNLFRRAERVLREGRAEGSVEVMTIGRKARDYFTKRPNTAMVDVPDVIAKASFERTEDVAQKLTEGFLAGRYDSVLVLYNQFKSAMVQQVTLTDVLPVSPQAAGELATDDDEAVDYIYAPDQTALLAHLLPRFVAVQLFRAVLESAASEHGARMTAMDAATKNAQELAEGLTLQYNRARQAAITRELMDIVGGAEALAG
jgi:F-type H+-transporting ATPase subunit gamma